MSRKEQLQITVDWSVVKIIKKLAKDEDRSVSNMAQVLLKEALKKRKVKVD